MSSETSHSTTSKITEKESNDSDCENSVISSKESSESSDSSDIRQRESIDYAKRCGKKNILVTLVFTVFIGGLITLITFSGLYMNNYYNTLVCDIYDVTPVSLDGSGYEINYFFQYSYSAQGCDESGIYTVWNSNYYDALASRDRIANMTTTSCYAQKNSNQCDCYMSPPSSSGFFMGIFLGSLALVVTIIIFSCLTCLKFCD